MSKQADAKVKQNYQAKPVWPECRICAYFKSDKVKQPGGFVEEKNLRCEWGGFKVAKLGTCDDFLSKDDTKRRTNDSIMRSVLDPFYA